MTATKDENRLHGIAQLLVLEGLLEQSKAHEFQLLAMADKVSMVQYLVTHKIISASAVANTVAKNFGVPLIDLQSIDPETIPLSLVSDKLILRHHILPIFSRGNYLYLATDDPSKQATFKEIQFHTGLQPYPLVVETDKLTLYIDKILNSNQSQGLSEYVQGSGDLESLEISAEEEDSDPNKLSSAAEDAPVVKFVNKILLDAIKIGASDIHFEPYEREYRIRYRQDGILNEIAAPPVALSSRIAARIKVMSCMDISERRIPQDGRFKMKLSKTRAIDFRVSSCPTVGGEKIVMRLLDPGGTKLGIEVLGFSPKQEESFLKSINKPQGMILVTGPTGSGKTVTLYSALNLLNTPEVNISTAEDPVEMKIPGINQVQMNVKAGLTFSGTLRSFLRQDPDIVMVGEIRDLETAEIAVTAAQTGHLVLSTLHTNSAPETLTRLVNMGIPSFNLAGSVSLIIAQRLARKLCEACKKPYAESEFSSQSLLELGFTEEELPTLKLCQAVGCEQCNAGYRGRLGLFEVLLVTKAIGEIIMAGGNSLDIQKQAQKEGMLTIYQSGLEKVKAGLTTIEEVNRVTIE